MFISRSMSRLCSSPPGSLPTSSSVFVQRPGFPREKPTATPGQSDFNRPIDLWTPCPTLLHTNVKHGLTEIVLHFEIHTVPLEYNWPIIKLSDVAVYLPRLGQQVHKKNSQTSRHFGRAVNRSNMKRCTCTCIHRIYTLFGHFVNHLCT